MNGWLDRMGKAVAQAKATHFPAPSAQDTGALVELTADAVRYSTAPERRRLQTLLLFLLGLTLTGVPILFIKAAGWDAWPALFFLLFGVPMSLLSLLAPFHRSSLEVNSRGIEKETAWGRRVKRETIPASRVRAIRFVRNTHEERVGTGDHATTREVTRWRVGAVLDDGTVVGLLVDGERSRVRAVAELAHALLSAGAGRALLLEDHSVLEGGDASGLGLDATLAQRAQRAPADQPREMEGFDVHAGPAGTRIVATRAPWLGRLKTAAPLGIFGLVALGMGGTFMGLLWASTLGPEGGPSPGLQAARLLVSVVPGAIACLGAYLAFLAGLDLFGREYVTVDANVLERGVEGLGRAWRCRRVPVQALEHVRAGNGLEVFDGGQPVSIGFKALSRAQLGWLADAIMGAVRAHAPAAGSPRAPPGWPLHARIRVIASAGEVRIVPLGVAWGWLIGVSAFGLAFLLAGLPLTAALPYLAFTQLANEPWALRLLVTGFAAIPASMAYFGGRLLHGAWTAFARGENAHVVRRGVLELHVPGAKAITRVDLARVKQVKIDHGNVVLATNGEDVTLAFHRLRRAQDVAWARDAIEYAIHRYG